MHVSRQFRHPRTILPAGNIAAFFCEMPQGHSIYQSGRPHALASPALYRAHPRHSSRFDTSDEWHPINSQSPEFFVGLIRNPQTRPMNRIFRGVELRLVSPRQGAGSPRCLATSGEVLNLAGATPLSRSRGIASLASTSGLIGEAMTIFRRSDHTRSAVPADGFVFNGRPIALPNTMPRR